MHIQAAGKTIAVTAYPGAHPAPGTPVVFLLTGGEKRGNVPEEVRKRTESAFVLAEVPVADWGNELSPWPAEKVFRSGSDFGSGANDTVRALTEEIVPAVLASLGISDSSCWLAGYSLAGLFAVYALYRTDRFAGAASASGSLWFPGFMEYAGTHRFVRKPERMYLSLGDRESRTKNPVMRRVEECTRALEAVYRAQGIPCVFEHNPGNHFQDAEIRLAKGIVWLLNTE